VCNMRSCPTGCCAGGVCTAPSLAACGTLGGTCLACNPMAADNCSAVGRCQCGLTAPCASGSRCGNGACVCDATSCPGCCDGDVCRAGTAKGKCGSGGVACASCPGGTMCRVVGMTRVCQ
jgi:hypothetical protein